jgi:hypothetical protein
MVELVLLLWLFFSWSFRAQFTTVWTALTIQPAPSFSANNDSSGGLGSVWCGLVLHVMDGQLFVMTECFIVRILMQDWRLFDFRKFVRTTHARTQRRVEMRSL